MPLWVISGICYRWVMGMAMQSFVRILLAVALVFSPALPQVAFASDAPLHSVHAQHHASHTDGMSQAADADHHHDQVIDSGTSDHASCSGNCCAACTHCATATPVVVSGAPMRSVQIAAPQLLHATYIASSLNRPPKPV